MILLRCVLCTRNINFSYAAWKHSQIDICGARSLLNVNKSQTCTRRDIFDLDRSLKGRTKLNTGDLAKYAASAALCAFALSYLAVPVYRLYCQATGKGGKPYIDKAEEKVAKMLPDKSRKLNIIFVADANSRCSWNFRPTQDVIQISPGETALAFFTAYNPTDEPVVGVATYSVQPYEAGIYLNKIQCFCFEEQRLDPKEEVDLPVFFYIDPEYSLDPRLEFNKDVVLSYTFFQAKEPHKLPEVLDKVVDLVK